MMNISKIILEKLESEHRGREKSIPREDLLEHCRIYDSDLRDDTFRKIYNKLPICVCNEGLFWPIRPEEVIEFGVYLRKKAIPLFERAKMVEQYHWKLINGFQTELFNG